MATRIFAKSLVTIKANTHKMVTSTNDIDKKMTTIFLDMHATLEKMIVDQREKKAQQGVAAALSFAKLEPATTMMLAPIVVLSNPVVVLSRAVAALMCCATVLPGIVAMLLRPTAAGVALLKATAALLRPPKALLLSAESSHYNHGAAEVYHSSRCITKVCWGDAKAYHGNRVVVEAYHNVAWLLLCLLRLPPHLPWRSQMSSILLHPCVEVAVFKVTSWHHSLSSSWDLLELQPWPPPQLKDELSPKGGEVVMC